MWGFSLQLTTDWGLRIRHRKWSQASDKQASCLDVAKFFSPSDVEFGQSILGFYSGSNEYITYL